MQNPRISIQRLPWSDSTCIYISYRAGDKLVHLQPAMPAVIKPEDHGMYLQPLLKLEGKEEESLLQGMMDELWNLGIRPRDVGSAGHLAAVKEHLNDFRKIVSKQLEVEL